MVDETDGIEEAIEGQMRLLVTAAAQAGDRLARTREDTLRRAQATSEREARELQSRFAAEQRAVRADLSAVQRTDWWEKATPQRIAQAYESAVAWRDEEPEAARAEQRIVDELRTRHGIDPDELRSQVAVTNKAREQQHSQDAARATARREELRQAQDWARTAAPEALREYKNGIMGTDRAEDERPYQDRLLKTYREANGLPDPEAEHQRQAEQRDRAEAAALMAKATDEEDRAQDRREDRPDRPALADEHQHQAESAREEAGAKYDSAERRSSTAADLESQGHDHETVARQMRADVSQGTPATEATKDGRAPRARKDRGRAGTSRQRERGGLSR